MNDAPIESSDGFDVFTVSNTREDKDSRIDIEVGGVRITAIIDSGASINIIDRHLWEYLKKHKVSCTSHLTNMKLYAYGSLNSLDVAGWFKAQVTVYGTDKSLQDVTFYVIEENGQPLLGKDAASKLGILHIDKIRNSESRIVQQITDTKGKLKTKCPECFEGLGELKDLQL